MNTAGLNAMQASLKAALAKKDSFDEAIRICLELHSVLHASEVSGSTVPTYEDELTEGLTDAMYREMPLKKDATIAWCLWHLSRIEDVTVSLLIADGSQVFETGGYLHRINSGVTDTGNAMTDDEIIAFSARSDIWALREYRAAVGKNTREIIKCLTPADLKRKPDARSLKRISDEGAVLDVEGSRWLIDYWGGKTVSGLLLMPVTRHLIVHLNEAFRIKKSLKHYYT